MWLIIAFLVFCFSLSTSLTCHSGKRSQQCWPFHSCYQEVVFNNCKGTTMYQRSGCALFSCAFVKKNECFSYSSLNNAYTYQFCCCSNNHCNRDIKVMKRSKQGAEFTMKPSNEIFEKRFVIGEELVPDRECSWYNVLLSYYTEAY